ncbi:Solute carrier family 35 member E3 [Golovinomyces cichoracearum]|uniref:GDP-mannose transporter n=1 Tax=Golovinomyces cichoracearum TaxID=62708 RepID=A0A420JAI7_9PEZI|nr:Solute carrier family 35 member E3 [Golovinomyces cichoracearum]
MADRDAEIARSSFSEHNNVHVEAEDGICMAENAISPTTIPDEIDTGDDIERAGLLPNTVEEKPASSKSENSTRLAIVWMIVNTLATIGIVFTNKAIFSDSSLRFTQLTFAAFHFFITWLTLFTLSKPRFAMFTPKRATIREIIPLAIAMALNVILPNLSLAFSTVTFYQVARILLTPTVALMNFIIYKATLPRKAILALIPACLGVGMVSYYDSKPAANSNVKTTSSLGVIFACVGIFASSLYTIWIASYHKKLNMNSMQLLYNQAPLAAFMLLYIIPFVDTFPVWTEVPVNRWVMIMMVGPSNFYCLPPRDLRLTASQSGIFASLINMSQFFIIAQTGPVSSTVVGHVKTCSIVAIGWAISGRAVGDKALVGVFIALGGIITYSIIMLRHKVQLSKV